MSQETINALIAVAPQVAWLLFALALVIALRKPIVQDLLPRLGGVRLGIVEISLLPEAVEVAANEAAAKVGTDAPPRGVGEVVVERARRLAPALAATSVLWHDPNPANSLRERQFMHDMRVFVEISTSLDAARQALQASRQRPFDVVISNIGADSAGLRVMDLIKDLTGPPRLIYYVARLDISRGTPGGAFGITNRPDELLHLVMDAVERRGPRARLP